MNPRMLAVLLFGLVFFAGTGALVNEPRTPDPPPDDDAWIDVMTYNLHQYWSTAQTGRHSLLGLHETIADANPDIVGVQESEGGRVTSGSFDGVRWLAEQLDFHRAPGPPARDSIYGVALLSRWPILQSTWHPLPQRIGVESGVLLNTVDHPNGTITIAVTHFDIRGHPGERARQAEGLVRLVENRGPLIVLGDFNTPVSPDDAAHRNLTSAFADAWVVSGRPPQGGPTELVPGRDPARIDRILLRGDWIVNECSTRGGPEASDHRAVICAVRPAEVPA